MNYDVVSEALKDEYPYFQQIIAYWSFIDTLLFAVAQELEREKCKFSYDELNPHKLEKFLVLVTSFGTEGFSG